jgi:hypothetical protein
MDVSPENINPTIVQIGRTNPAVKAIFAMYLAETGVVDGEPLTWRQALELMVEKLAKQYAGALEGWKDAAKQQEEPKAGPLALVDEKSVELEVEPEVDRLRRDLELAKGVLSRIISPVRAAYAAKGRSEEAPPLVLSQGIVEQAARILGGYDTKAYIQGEKCEKCGYYAWFVENGEPKCAVCDARAGKLKLVLQKQQLQQEKESLSAELARTQFLAEGKMGYE